MTRRKRRRVRRAYNLTRRTLRQSGWSWLAAPGWPAAPGTHYRWHLDWAAALRRPAGWWHAAYSIGPDASIAFDFAGDGVRMGWEVAAAAVRG